MGPRLVDHLLYEPEGTHDPEGIGAGWKKESKLGISGALSYRIVPTVLLGAELDADGIARG